MLDVLVTGPPALLTTLTTEPTGVPVRTLAVASELVDVEIGVPTGTHWPLASQWAWAEASATVALSSGSAGTLSRFAVLGLGLSGGADWSASTMRLLSGIIPLISCASRLAARA